MLSMRDGLLNRTKKGTDSRLKLPRRLFYCRIAKKPCHRTRLCAPSLRCSSKYPRDLLAGTKLPSKDLILGHLHTIRSRPIASTSSFHVASSGCTRKVSKIRSFDASFALGAARVRQYREIRRPTPPTRAQPDGHSIQPRERETSCALRRRPARQRATPAVAQSVTRYSGNPHSHALRQRQPTQKRGRCQSNGPDQTMRYISLRKRFLISSTLASRGLPGAQASA